MHTTKLNVLFVVGGYPTLDNQSHGVFNKRAAVGISEFVNLAVLHLRIFKPGRKIFTKSEEDGFVKYTLCIPFIPIHQKKLFLLNNLIFFIYTKIYAFDLLKKADIVHTGDGVLSVFISKFKKNCNFKLIAQFIGGDINQDLDGLQKSGWVKDWLKTLNGVTFNSNALLNKFELLFGSHENSKIIYRGINIEVFTPSTTKVKGLRFYYLGGLPNYTTFTHGRNTKGGVNLMKSWELIDSNPEFDLKDIHLSFAGPDSNIELAQQWKRSLRRPDRVSLIGSLSYTDIISFHQKNNILLVPSLEEGLPNVSVEASAVGNCIIATKAGGIPEVIENGTNGLLCEDYSIESLYEKMREVIKNSLEIEFYGVKAREVVQTKFNSLNFAQQYLEFYQKTMKR